MKKNNTARLPLKLAAGAVIFLLFLCSMIYGWRSLSGSDYFRVKNVFEKKGNVEELSYLKGRNIFSIDLEYEAGRLLELYPDSSRIRLIRLLPNSIFVDFVKRKPVAMVKLHRYFAIDEEAVFFNAQSLPEEMGLPVISGFERKVFVPKPGKKYNIIELSAALSIIKEIKANRYLKNYRIGKIDVTNITNASIFIPLSASPQINEQPASLEIRLGADNVRDRLAMLAKVIIAAKDDITAIKYIDLRFKEPVIKLKDAK